MRQEKEDGLVIQDIQGKQDQLGILDIRDQKVIQVMQQILAQLDIQDKLAQLDIQGTLVQLDTQEEQAQLAQPVVLDTLVILDQLGILVGQVG